MDNFIFRESVSKVNLAAFNFKAVEEYPGMYSLIGVKAMNTMVKETNKTRKNTYLKQIHLNEIILRKNAPQKYLHSK